MDTPAIFISYRRDDTAGYARAVYDALAADLGAQRVFMDVDDIPAGQAFDQAIAQAVGSARVLLVLIGPRWLTGFDGGSPRLHDPADFVHQEVAAGLSGGLHVIPLIFDGGTMPSEAQLPPALKPLAKRQALVMDARRFRSDAARLVASVRDILGERAPEPALVAPRVPVQAPPSRRGLWLAAAAGLVVLGGGAWLGRSAVPDWRDPGPPASRVAAPAPAVVPAPPPAPVPEPAYLPPLLRASAPAVARPAVNGQWRAEVVYDWPNARYIEYFDLAGERGQVQGMASFLRVPRAIVEGQVDGAEFEFVTRTQETGEGGAMRNVTHRYRGKLVGKELQLVMQTEGSASAHAPVTIVAQRMQP